MIQSPPGLTAVYAGWADLQAELVGVLAPLTQDQLALRPPRPRAPALGDLAAGEQHVWRSVEDLQPARGGRKPVTRGWAIWRVIEHELQHGTEIAVILRHNGLKTIEL